MGGSSNPLSPANLILGPIGFGTSAAGSAASAVGNLLKPKIPGMPAAPTVPDVTPAPSPDDAQVAAAKRKSQAEQAGRYGRLSTILTPQTSDKLGG